MSTLRATNIKNPDSGSNNIVLDGSGGVVISSNVDVGGNVSIAGTLTYEDVTNIDSIGIVTARAGIVLGPTANTIQLGTGTTISSPSSNTFTVLTNGSERVRVDSSGRFGLGTGSPSNPLHVTNDSSTVATAFFNNTSTGGDSPALIVQGGANNNNTTGTFEVRDYNGNTDFKVQGDGKVGIATVTPNTYLHVFGVPDADFGTAVLFDSTSTAANVGGVLTLGGYKTGQTGQSLFGFIKGGKENSTSGNESGYLAFGTNNNTTNAERCRISSTGGFSVGTTANPGAGAIYATGDITAFYSSDIRLKKDIQPISEPIKKLMEISGVTYKWNEEYLKDKDVDGYFVRETEVGVIAQDVEKVLPEVVATRENGYKAVRYEKLVALLIEAVKDQQKQIDELKARLEEV